MKFLQKIFGNKSKTLGDHDFFNQLIRLAGSDDQIKLTIVKLISIEPEARHAQISTLLANLERSGAPAELLTALRGLQKNEVAEKIKVYLKEKS